MLNHKWLPDDDGDIWSPEYILLEQDQTKRGAAVAKLPKQLVTGLRELADVLKFRCKATFNRTAEQEVLAIAKEHKADLVGYYRMRIDGTFGRMDDPLVSLDRLCDLLLDSPLRRQLLVYSVTKEFDYDEHTVIREFLQNIDDAYHTLGANQTGKPANAQFTCRDDRLTVTHEGRQFNERDVRGLCSMGGADKSNRTRIGASGSDLSLFMP